jgi:hypothetical protein
MNENTKSPKEAFNTHDWNGRAMIRGDRVPLAIWTVTNSTEKKKTTNVSIDAAIIPTAARAPCGPKPNKRSSRLESQYRVNRAEASAASMQETGTIHNEFLRKLRNCLRFNQNMPFDPRCEASNPEPENRAGSYRVKPQVNPNLTLLRRRGIVVVGQNFQKLAMGERGRTEAYEPEDILLAVVPWMDAGRYRGPLQRSDRWRGLHFVRSNREPAC